MARSKITQNKKENEKRKEKKRQEKSLRKSEQKLNNNKGKSFENMIAYVDEFGRITSEPSERAKTPVNASEISISTAKQEHVDIESYRRNGVLKLFHKSKGFGFITDLQSGESVFVHINHITGTIVPGDKVTFTTESGPRGLSATSVRKL